MVLAKKYRLYRRKDFFAMRGRLSRRAFWKYGTVLYRKNDMPHNRFAFVVSAKVSKKSTVRNLIKRRTSEWIRKNTRRMGTGYDVAFLFSKEAVGAAPAAFYDDLERLFQSVRILL